MPKRAREEARHTAPFGESTREVTIDAGRSVRRVKKGRLHSLARGGGALIACMLLQACGGRSNSLEPMGSYGVDYMILEREFAYVVVVDAPISYPDSILPGGREYEATWSGNRLDLVVDAPISYPDSILPGGREYEATWSGNRLDLLGEEYRLEEGRLFCARVSSDEVTVTQLDVTLPNIADEPLDAIEDILTSADVVGWASDDD